MMTMNPTLLSLVAALIVVDADGLGGVRVELETEFVHLQPQQVHLSVSGEVKHGLTRGVVHTTFRQIINEHSRNLALIVLWMRF